MPLSSRKQPKAAEDGREALEILGGEQRVDALLHVGGRAAASLKRSKTSGSTWPRISAALLPTSTARSPGLRSLPRKYTLPDRQAALRSRRSSSWWRREPHLLLADERGLVCGLRLALLPREHLLRAEKLDGLAIDRVVQRHGPEDVLALLLAARAQLRGECLERLAVVREVDVEHHVAVHDLAAVDGEARLEGLGVEERVRGLRLPERREHLGVEPLGVARLRVDAVAKRSQSSSAGVGMR